MAKNAVKEASVTTPTIIGTYEGECADANITNKNGLDITRPVWENVFNSNEYKEAIDNGWYIGFLGHPEDPNCMDFEHACIVMTEGHIDADGKVYGKFNLVDTPVGRVVKAFQDAGVTFGISVRGARDIVDNSVDPDTFVFRGFDLVSFPAYPNSIPTFTEIAASTDMNKRKQYQILCSTVMKNMESLNTPESVEVVKSCFAEQSDEYKALDSYQAEMFSSTEIAEGGLDADRVAGLVQLYNQEHQRCQDLEEELVYSQEQAAHNLAQVQASADRKLRRVERIMAAQLTDMDDALGAAQHDKVTLQKKVMAAEDKVSELESLNLKYKHKINSSVTVMESKDSAIEDLKSSKSETVRELEAIKSAKSNLDGRIMSLEAEVRACKQLISDYQDAYANLYATAIGVNLESVPVTASTSVDELRTAITGSVGLHHTTDELDVADIVDLDNGDDGTLVTV